MQVYGKVWGTTSPIFCRNNVEIHRITGIKDRYCSKHYHVKKFNLFLVETGKLLVKVWKSYGLVDETLLGPGMTCTVRPGETHQFQVLEEGTVALEVYWTEIEPDDIVRDGVGG